MQVLGGLVEESEPLWSAWGLGGVGGGEGGVRAGGAGVDVDDPADQQVRVACQQAREDEPQRLADRQGLDRDYIARATHDRRGGRRVRAEGRTARQLLHAVD